MKKISRQQAIDFTLLLLRIAAGVIFIQAGGLKLFGWLMILFGIFTRPVSFILAGEMAVAYFIGHIPMGLGIWPIQNHGQPAVLLCFIFLFMAAYGAGAWSLGAWRANRKLKTL